MRYCIAGAPGAAAAIFDLDGADDQHFDLMAASATPGDRIVFAAASDFGFIHLDETGEPAAPRGEHVFGHQPSCLSCRQPRPRRHPQDRWLAGYPGAAGITHDPHVVGKMAAYIVLPWVHRIFSNLKVWALGVYHGLRRRHLQSYLDEFVFRFNRRRTRHAAFRSLLGIASDHPPFTYQMLISPETKG